MSRGVYRLTVRRGGGSERARLDTLDDALRQLELRLDAIASSGRRQTARALGREYEPVTQVAARGEIAGPGRLRAGVDLRGDGSAEAFTGRLRRRLIAREAGETAYEALRRVLAARSSG